ncbi:MAG TPA: response regulator, partial [Polyangia bacterium]
NTDAVSNGEQALQWLRAHPGEKCVVLLDLMMPVMTGWEFLKVRERDPLLLETPVLVMTAAGVCKEIRTQFHHLLACVPKPFSLEAVLKIVDASCRQ